MKFFKVFIFILLAFFTMNATQASAAYSSGDDSIVVVVVDPPTVTTAPTVTATVTSITQTTATFSVTVTAGTNPSTLTSRGVCLPLANCSPEGGTAVGTFSVTKGGLTANTTYSYKGFASNTPTSFGYSPDATFTTLPNAPVVTISANPPSGPTGTQPSITWSATNNPTFPCTATGTGPGWPGTKAVSGNAVLQTAINTVGTYTYTLSCANTGGSSSDTAYVSIGSTPGLPLVCNEG